MAYVDQSLKAKLAPTIKAILKKYGLKGSLAVRHHSTLVLNIKSGKIDFIRNFNSIAGAISRPNHLPFQPATKSIDVNTYWLHEHFSGEAKACLTELKEAMEGPDFFNNDDCQSDYFNRRHYIDLNIGNWDKPYTLEA